MTEDNPTLPPHWERKRVSEVLGLRNGYAFKPSDWAHSGRPIIRIQNLKSESALYNYYEGELPDRFKAHPGDLLFAWSGTPGTSFGAHIWEGPEAWVNQHIFRVDFSDSDFDRDFLKLALNHNLTDYIAQAQGGVGLAHITKAKLDQSLLIHPPLDVQRSIAHLIAENEELRDTASDHLKVAQRSIERLRHAVLAAACSGRLTADWRSQYGLPDTAGESSGFPEGWKKTKLGDIAASIRGGSTEVPENTPTDFPILRSSSVRPFEIDFADVRYLNATQSQRVANFIREGDLLITRLSLDPPDKLGCFGRVNMKDAL